MRELCTVLERYGVQLWLPEAEGSVDLDNPAHEALPSLLAKRSLTEVLRSRHRAVTAMRCRHGHTTARTRPDGVPRNLYLREDHLLGPDHPDTLYTRLNVIGSRALAGQATDGITEHERLLGQDHPYACLSLAILQNGPGDPSATAVDELLAACLRALGPEHPTSGRYAPAPRSPTPRPVTLLDAGVRKLGRTRCR